MRKILRSRELQRLLLSVKQGLIIALLIIASMSAISQVQNHAVGLYSGPKIVSKQATVNSVIKSTVSETPFVLQSSPLTTGTWTALTSPSHYGNNGVCLLLSDGRVLCHTGAISTGDIYDILTPDIHGSYINGTWSVSAESQRWRYSFSSDVLKDGRVYVGGGEYGTDGTQSGSHAEVYDPVTNTWSAETTPGQVISDGNSEILSDGRILQALLYDFYDLKHTAIFNPVTNTWSAGPDSHGVHNESMWLKLPDNSILMVDMQRLDSSYTFTTPPHTERYIPSSNTWVVDANVPVDLYDSYGYETGPAFLLPDGRAFFMGSSGHTAYYTPSGTTSPGTWTAGPNMPNGTGMPDAPGSMMINGKILFACSPVPSSGNTAPKPTYWYEFDYLTNTYTQINAPQGGLSYNDWSQHNTLLNLPDGSVLAAINGSTTYYVYTPAGSAIAAGKPTISNVIPTSCYTYNVTGTGFNGIGEGSAFGDENQNASNYPLIRLANGANVYYCRTSNWNSTGVMRGNAKDSVTMTLPAGIPDGTYSMVVTANGIASDPVNLTVAIKNCLCSPPLNLTATNVTTSSATITWDAVTNASNYIFYYKESSSSTWIAKYSTTNKYNLKGLLLYTNYDVKVQTKCPDLKSNYSKISFRTTYGGPAYCTIGGNTGYEYINKVILGSISNQSGNNNGYGDYTALSTELVRGTSAKITLFPGFNSGPYDEFWEVYIDYNQNGAFTDAGELVAAGDSTGKIIKHFKVKSIATLGLTRMRIVMHYGSLLGTSCGAFQDGEAEDYTVNIVDAAVTANASEATVEKLGISSMLIMPNPVSSSSATAVLNLTKPGNVSVEITDLAGRTLYQQQVANAHAGKNAITLRGLNIPNGVYVVRAKQEGILIGRTKIVVNR